MKIVHKMDFRISYVFLGENGIIKELKSSKEFQAKPSLYDTYTNPPNNYEKWIK